MFRNTLYLVVLAAPACRAPDEEPLDAGSLVEEIERREKTDRLRLALELVELPPLLLEGTRADLLDDVDGGAVFRRLALGYEPGVRIARREFLAARARVRSAGRPGPIAFAGRERDLENAGDDVEVTASLDVLGLLGLGPAAAARALADAETRRAFAAFEEAAWEARFRADEARLSLATELGLQDQLSVHLEEARKTLHRVEALDRRGRLPPAAVERARSFVHLLGQQVADSRVRSESRRADLARICGLPVDASLLDQLTAHTIDHLELEQPPTEPIAGSTLVRSHPQLRRLCLDYATREARLREAVASGWPSLRVGPRVNFVPGDLLTGGLVQFETPWPGSSRGRVEAALQDRIRAREAIEDALLAVLTRRSVSLQQLEVAESSLRLEALPALRGSGSTWRGLQARFQVDESAWDLWTDALALRARSVVAYWRTRETAGLARIAAARDSVLLEAQP